MIILTLILLFCVIFFLQIFKIHKAEQKLLKLQVIAPHISGTIRRRYFDRYVMSLEGSYEQKEVAIAYTNTFDFYVFPWIRSVLRIDMECHASFIAWVYSARTNTLMSKLFGPNGMGAVAEIKTSDVSFDQNVKAYANHSKTAMEFFSDVAVRNVLKNIIEQGFEVILDNQKIRLIKNNFDPESDLSLDSILSMLNRLRQLPSLESDEVKKIHYNFDILSSANFAILFAIIGAFFLVGAGIQFYLYSEVTIKALIMGIAGFFLIGFNCWISVYSRSKN